MGRIPLLFFLIGQSPGRFFSNVFVLCFIHRPGRIAIGAAAAVTAAGCICEQQVTPSKPVLPEAVPDSMTVTVSADYPIRHTDFFIYRDIPTKPLESHLRAAGRVAKLPSSIGDRTIVAIANCPREFRLEALGNFDSAERLVMYYRDEDPEHPLLSAVANTGEDGLHMELTPLLCQVLVVSVDNCTGEILQNPQVCLKGINARAEMLRSDGFRPAETVDFPDEVSHPAMMRAALPCDVGIYAQYPGIRLFCYPNDGEETIGTPRTSLVFSALVNGERKEWVFPLPAVRRGSTVPVHMVIE